MGGPDGFATGMGSDTDQIAIDASTPLTGEIDVEALIARIPASNTLRGLFFGPFVADLGDDFEALAPKLIEPPGDRYLSLAAYPLRDFTRVFNAAARRVYPNCPGREAYRLRARAMVEIFQKTLLGKAMLSVINDPATLLRRYPESIGLLNTGFRGRGTQEGPNAVKIELKKFFGSPEFMLGVFESFVLLHGSTPHTEVQTIEPGHLTFLVTWR
jgi:uncharacterized protein (TIGR02265 family)